MTLPPPLFHRPPAKQLATARETMTIFAPLAHRLGMWQYKTELSDLSFKYLFPKEFEAVQVRLLILVILYILYLYTYIYIYMHIYIYE